ncbi:MAG: hypothetical protein G8D28_10260 [gamma proteobacterium symbiont of Phacoides pectinatus]
MLFGLQEQLPGASLSPCPPDPNKDGADAPCYSGAYPIDPLLQQKQVDISGFAGAKKT